MKKLSFLALAVAGLLLGACSEKDVQEVQTPVSNDFKDGGFIGISLSLPSADAATRANDELSNGIEEEFAVKNATLYIFKLPKTSTANPDVAATYVDKVSLGNTYDPDKEEGIDPDKWEVQEGVDDTNITSTYSKATLIPNELASQMKADTENYYYAYVIINHNGQVNVSDGDTFEDFSNQEFNVIGADIALEQKIWETGMLMTNAPICDKAGGSAAPANGRKYSTLVQLDNTKIFGSKAEAEEAPAACVYVERAAVKITVEDGRASEGKKIGDYDVTINGWKVINVEPTYYNTRHINNDGTDEEDWGPYKNDNNAKANTLYRFVSLYQFLPTLPETTGHTEGFRTYFAKDVQYEDDAALNFTNADDDRPWIAVGKHAYTTENTFDVAHQTWQNTTMVTLKVTIGDGTFGFFTVGKGSQIMYVDDADLSVAGARTAVQKAAAAIENILKNDNDVASALAELRTEVSKNHVGQEVKSGLKVEFEIPTAGSPAKPVGKTGVTFTVTPAYTIDDGAYAAFNQGDEATIKASLESAINTFLSDDELANDVLLNYYAAGVSYYNVRIKHFGDYETPWSPSLSAALEAATPGSGYIAGGGANVNEIYFGTANDADGNPVDPSDAKILDGQQKFLGRYGVVRDNWYKLSIDKIGKIGDAEPVDPSTTTPDTPDDEIENFISVHVHIVPWVLRQQSVEF